MTDAMPRPRRCDRPALALMFLLTLAGSNLARAQGTAADYRRADELPGRLRDKVFTASVRPHWFHQNRAFWYRADRAGDVREFIVIDAGTGQSRPAFDHAKVAEALAMKLGKPAANPLPVDRIAIEDDGTVRLAVGDKGFRFDPATGALTDAEPIAAEPQPEPRGRGRGGRGPRQPGAPRRSESPDGRWAVKVHDHNLVLVEKEGGGEHPLTTEGTDADGYESAVFWAPDSTRLVAFRTAKPQEHKVYLIESSPRDQLQPKLHDLEYQKPGDAVAVRKPHLFDVASRQEIPVSDALFANPWSIDDLRWAPDSSRFTFVFNQRGHQVLRLIAVDAATGAARTIIDEVSPTFVDYAHKQFAHYFDATDEILWMSERDGWNHLYLFDAKTGAVKNRVTQGEWLVRGIDRVDDPTRQVWFQAGGLNRGEDPYHVHHARVNLDGTGFTRLTEGDGTHTLDPSPDGRYYLDTHSRVDRAPIVELRRAHDGALITTVERADVRALEATGWKPPQRFVAKGRDGTTDIHGVIYRPLNHDPAKKYPVIEDIYAGPQGAFVPNGFSGMHRQQVLAELGFIVVQIDGMGTNWRSKAFHDVCWKNLADAGFPDRIAWMKAAAAIDPSMDLSRVGLYGGSAGGQNALGGLLFHPEFYKVGAADCGCHDNRMDKIWWNELWMSWPIGPHYAEQSNVTNAHKLRGKLLLTVGELDRNVDPASTMQVVDALIKADKDFELIVFPGGGHGSGGSPYGQRRLRDFFVRHLHGVEPRLQ